MKKAAENHAADKPKKPIFKKWWFWVLVVVVIAAIGSGTGGKDKPAADNPSQAQTEQPSNQGQSQAPAVETTKQPDTISYQADLSSGHYTAGIDFPAGKYDIVAIEGGGNVSSSNVFSGGLNAVMGTADMNANGLDMYEQEYSNINLPDGTILSISGVTVNISSDKADGAPLKPRNQSITESVELGNGNFVSGEDFEPGIYDISAVSGGGNVSSDNMYNGGLNAILGTSDKNANGLDMYEQEYKNIDLPSGTTLTISGVKIMLTPSK